MKGKFKKIFGNIQRCLEKLKPEKPSRIFVAVFAVFLLAITVLPNPNLKAEIQNSDPSPDYFETSMYLSGRVALSVILPESDGSIDRSTQDWNETNVVPVENGIRQACDFFVNESKNFNANLTFFIQFNIVDCPYEAIDRPRSDKKLWIGATLTTLGYPALGRIWEYQLWDYANSIRDTLKTDWTVVIYVCNSFNDSDGRWPDGGDAFNSCTPPLIYMTSTLSNLGAEAMINITAHELANVFFAFDEDTDRLIYGGYLNVTNVPRSGCLMDNLSMRLSQGTKQQLGWVDSDHDGVIDILDTTPKVFIDSTGISGRRINCTGTATVTPSENKGRIATGRNVTINRIEKVQVNIYGTWLDAQITPTTLTKLKRYPNVYENRTTYSIISYNYTLSGIVAGNHTIQVRVIDDWNNYAQINTTVTIQPLFPTDVFIDGRVDIADLLVTAQSYNTRPGDPRWNSYCDFDKNGIIDIEDVKTVARDFGRTT